MPCLAALASGTTLAEAALIEGRTDEARERYAQAVAVAPDHVRWIVCTRRNARLLVQHLAAALDAVPGVLTELVDRPIVDSHTDDRAVQQLAHLQPVERPERHHLREIAGDPEHDEHIGRPRFG